MSSLRSAFGSQKTSCLSATDSENRCRMSEVMSIPLYGGKELLIDAVDYDLVSRHTWSASPQPGGRTYAIHKTYCGKAPRITLFLHRLIMKAPKGMQVDHINGNGLDNRRCNLRLATQQQNGRNSGKQANNTSGYVGVHWHRQRDKWQASIVANGKRLSCGLFHDPKAAALARDAKAKEIYGEFAYLNFPEATCH